MANSTSIEFTPVVNDPVQVANNDTLNDVEEIDLNQPKKRRGKNKQYFEVCMFKDFETADKMCKDIFDEQKWRKGKLDNQEKRRYSCYSQGSKGNFPVQMYLLLHQDSQKCTLYMSTDKHNHASKCELQFDDQRLNPNVRDEIIRIYENETKSTALILDKLDDKGMVASVHQIYNLIHRYKVRNYGSRNMTLNELKLWCTQNQDIPESLDKVFVANTYFEAGLDEVKAMRIYFTTKRLMSLVKKTKHICIYATYKLLWQGFPVIIIGTTDRNKSFHPFGLVLSKDEKTEDYAFAFSSVKQLTKQLYDFDIYPNALVADAAQAITNAFKSVYGENYEYERIYCWAHVIRRIDDRLKTINHKKIKESLRNDILNLQAQVENHNFKSVTKSFIEKWKIHNDDPINAFLEYFEDEWVKSNSG